MANSIQPFKASVPGSSSQTPEATQEILTSMFDLLPLELICEIFALIIANPNDDTTEIKRRSLFSLSLISKYSYEIVVPISVWFLLNSYIRMQPAPSEISKIVSVLQRQANSIESKNALVPVHYRSFHKELRALGLSVPKAIAVVTHHQFAEFQKQLEQLNPNLIKIWEEKLRGLGFQHAPDFDPEISDDQKATQIRECLKHKDNQQILDETIKLHLNNLSLTVLPAEIRLFKNLQTLNLNLNQLQTLPQWIGNLSNLQELFLNDNQLQILPDSIGDLSKLKDLYLNWNKLQALPDSFGNLSELEWLGLDNNQLQALPDSFGNLSNLNQLNLRQNKLIILPHSIGNLSKLERLALNNNQLQTLPDSIRNLSELNRLDLSCNQLQKLPDSIENLNKLEHLLLSNNLWIFLPDKILNCSNSATFDKYKEELNFPSQSALAKFYQFLMKKTDLEELKGHFEDLDSRFKNAVYGKIYEFSTDPQKNKDVRYGKHHCFDNSDLFYRSVRETFLAMFEQLSSDQKNRVHGYVHQLAESVQTTDLAQHQALDNLPRLIDAMAKLQS